MSSESERDDEMPMHLIIDADGSAFVRLSDPRQAVAAARARFAIESEARAKGARAVRRFTYGLADCLVDNAEVGVVRDPSEHTRATVIVSSAVQDDRLLLIARELLRADEKAMPRAETRRVLLAWPDGTIRLHVDGRTYWRRHEYQIINVRSYSIDSIRRYTESVPPTLVSGVGLARLVVLP